MGTLTDDDLRHLLGEAAAAYDVPEDGVAGVLDEAAADEAVVPFHRHRRVQLVAAAAVIGLGFALGVAVFGGNDVDRVGQLAGAERPSSSTATDELRQAPVDTGGSVLDGVALESASGDALLDYAPTAAAPLPAGGEQAAAPAPGAPTPDGARVVKTGAIALVVDDGRVTAVLTEVQSLAAAAGGEVAVAKTQELGPTPSGSVTLRVPVDAFEEVVAQVRSLDAEVRSATTAGKDVTAEYADLEAQLRSLKAARERFLEILSGARTIGDVLAVQQRVDEVTGRIDRLEGQRQVLAAQSERATLEVTVTEADDPVVAEQRRDDGLSKAFADAWHGFTSGVEGLIRLSGRGVLLLLCLGIGWVLLRLGWRASRRRLV